MRLDVVAAAAASLAQAASTRVAIEPLTERYPELTLDEAYAIQLSQANDRIAAGATVRGHKVGLTSVAMQRALGVDQPDFGYLFDDMFFTENQPIDLGRFLQARVEPEVAFLLGRPLQGPGVTAADAIRAVEGVVPALEIIDSRIRDWKIGLADTISDNASSAGVVLGSHVTRLDAAELRLVGCNLTVNGSVVMTGAAGAVLGSPLSALVWLANTVGSRGVALDAGCVVLPGSCTAAVPVGAGDTVTATFAGLGSVTARFTGGDQR